METSHKIASYEITLTDCDCKNENRKEKKDLEYAIPGPFLCFCSYYSILSQFGMYQLLKLYLPEQ